MSIREAMIEIVNGFMEANKATLIETGQIPGALALVKQGLPPLLLPFAFPDRESKQELVEMVRNMILMLKPDFAVISQEIYVKQVAEEAMKDYRHGDLSQDPEAQEGILVIAQGVGEVYGSIQIHRKEGDEIVFQEHRASEDFVAMTTSLFGNVWEMLEAKQAGSLQ